MSRMIVFLLIAVILFSAAAGASWYLQQKQGAEPDATKAAEDKLPKSNLDTAKAKPVDSGALRPLVRPPASTDSDRAAQMALHFQKQEETLKKREEQLVARSTQNDLIHGEIKKEQKKLDEVRKTIQAELALVQEKLELLERKSAEVATQSKQVAREAQDLDGKLTEVKGMEGANVKKLAAVYDKMDTDAAAQNIEQMIEKGKLDTAVAIISSMGQRQAAGLLAEVSKSDPGIAVQIIDRMRFFKAGSVAPK